MSEDGFSQKEILLQLMTEMRETRKDIAEQRVLLQSHISASVGRDEKIAELTKQVSTIRTDLEALQNSFAFFKFKVTLIAGAIATALSLAGQKLLANLLNL
jgi:hypothetical protein